jgi:hypothetical protein
MVDPSFNAINWLFRKVRTPPCIFTTCPVGGVANNSLILTRFIQLQILDRKARHFEFLIKEFDKRS